MTETMAKRKVNNNNNTNNNTNSNSNNNSNNNNSSIAMERHMIFVCPECGQTTDTQNEWRQHLNSAHDYAKKKPIDFDFKEIDKKYHECQICLKRLAHGHHSPVLLQYHRFSHLSYGGPFKCRYCAGTYVKKRALSVHLFRCHSQLMNKVDNEYKMEKMKQAIHLRHPRFNREFFMRFICPQCGKLFPRFNEWLEHLDSAHLSTSKNISMHRIISTNDFYCDQCSDILKNSPTWDELRRHHFSHLPYTTYFQCAFCITQKSFKTDLFLHFIKYHRAEFLKNKKYICAPDEWGGPAKELTLRQIEIYSSSDDISVIVQKERTNQEVRRAIQTLENIGDTEKQYSNNGSGETGCDNGTEHLVVMDPLNVFGVAQAQDDITMQTEEQPIVNDILQKALAESCINFEEDINTPNVTTTTTTHQQAPLGNPTQNGYKNIYVVDLPQQPKSHTEHVVLNDMELEEICQEMFEEIDAEVGTLSPNTKIITTNRARIIELQKREMQKYINYLCPECKHEFEDQPTWRTHVFKEHNLAQAIKSRFRPLNALKTAFLCLTCYQVQRNSKHVDLQRHYFQHMPHQGYLKCTLCKKTKSSKPKMLYHLEYIHRIDIQKTVLEATENDEQLKQQCLECDMDFMEDLQSHLKICPARLVPLSVHHYNNIENNMKILEHLKKASLNLDKMLLDIGIEPSTI